MRLCGLNSLGTATLLSKTEKRVAVDKDRVVLPYEVARTDELDFVGLPVEGENRVDIAHGDQEVAFLEEPFLKTFGREGLDLVQVQYVGHRWHLRGQVHQGAEMQQSTEAVLEQDVLDGPLAT